MPYRITPFVSEYFYHLFNRGVEKRIIFSNERDYQRFLQTLYYYQFSGPKPRFSMYTRYKDKDFSQNPKIVEVICYCLMPNHFHILIKQIRGGGIQEFMQKVINSYTKYYNTKHKRVGHLFQGTFKAVPVETEAQLLHVSRYIHLNPYASELTDDLEGYPYSSYPHFISLKHDHLCESGIILESFKDGANYKRSLKASPENEFSSSAYKEFVSGHGDYARELEQLKHLLLDPD
ncbi:hypothetical protein A3A14_01785 [Candidatus Daviesbacteria bacterium RIFCSPLOWO2_01_FULL_43_38]|uniref:Transposase IS200-like domain-containing protein n=3 Tax=Candidatus Daviesiibacteriota TaxID=1752718 RepID=A0A1F5K547_9BACT|nr:MAG: hypothetical protein UV33_C0029G0006 [Candidatus Daviesbacteria bacterium GW2011_GWA1_42_6]KKS69359.1 MAG: hypothetical protein UV41_C0056G0010 [Candidatus Daviesbacteria bacterium GW2011_GWA2_42_7]OGE20169.1 MAG: hypothetical protein A2874_03295 [Candidatus Daviesbacteria bacterium RIFCSPHIGHO2_01_FULL_43_17]OGE36066.1 MAG: hypothetical protein A3E45_03995 [Candidatus Daviesbacteria bacterium RIFCSPHIGHO2_12_FULL_43_11]OGE63972.1 MAG: hypothetical protein A3A14_01785 [Candidatus Davies